MGDNTEEAVWYFAYGSNMSPAVMVRRGLTPLDAKNALVETHVLVFDVFGVPFTEPAMAGIQRRPTHHSGPQVHGVAYRLSAADYHRLKVTEGAGTAYQELDLEAQVISEADTQHADTDGRNVGRPTEQRLEVKSFTARFPFRPARLPSARYMNLLIDGAVERTLPPHYVQYLHSLPSYSPPRLGWIRQFCAVRLFLGFWHPILVVTMKRIKASAGDGNTPEWAPAAVNILFRTMWLYHDTIHRSLWRCDGGVLTQ
ncbi:hypothetical protein B0T14DRAFT_435657 [Immersiella caudata]|uniref:gamma-glutamylcyclotransferase n=1 Tax=Immersiella caudata TaxID=314043 RepID=A0AA40BXQ1_9PEZI|nr:hypothetical protein B0T14DRAFT_435657 [Immersiella caudata]